VDARRDPASFALDMRLRNLQLPQLMPRLKQMQDALGSINGVIELQGEGNSAAKVLASADGQFAVIMGPGRMSNLLLEVAGLDIAEALAFLIGKDRQVRLRCAYADFGLQDGIATARSVAIDTSDTALLLRGAAVAALAAIAPPLALLGLVETGPGDDTRCGRDTDAAPGK
jgi:uncharacterized protein involved in outer membrane biogenesis